MGPFEAVARVGVLGTREDVGAVAEADLSTVARPAREVLRAPLGSDLLGAPAVVGKEQHQRVLRHPAALEHVEELADAAVHLLDHRGVDGHPAGEPFPGPGGFPRHDALVARGQRSDDEAELREPTVTLDGVPARAIPVEVPDDVGLARVDRPVRRGVGDVPRKKGRLASCSRTKAAAASLRASVKW